MVRTPKTPEEARRQVRELKKPPAWTASRPSWKPDGATACSSTAWTCCWSRSVAEEAHAQNLPLAVHTGDARDVTDAVDIGAPVRGARLVARRDSRRLLERMAHQGVYLDPTLGVAEAYAQYFGGKARHAEQLAGAAGRAAREC